MLRALPDMGRVELRLRPEDKATLTRANSLKQLDLTGYILGNALPRAEADIAEAERLTLSERNSWASSPSSKTRPRLPPVGCAPPRRASRFHDGHRSLSAAPRSATAATGVQPHTP